MSNVRIDVTMRGNQQDVAVVELHGPLDTVASYTFQEQMQTLMSQGVYTYVVNLEHLDYISSAGIGVFPGMIHTLQQQNGGLIFVRVPPKIYKLFEMIGLISLFPVMDSVEAALEAFDGHDE